MTFAPLLYALVESGGQREALLRIGDDFLKVRTAFPLASGETLWLQPQAGGPHLTHLKVISRALPAQLERLQNLLDRFHITTDRKFLPLLNLLLQYRLLLNRENIQAFVDFLSSDPALSDEELQVFLFFLKAGQKLTREESRAYGGWIRDNYQEEGIKAFLQESRFQNSPFFFPWFQEATKHKVLMRWDGKGKNEKKSSFRLWIHYESEKIAILGFWQPPYLYLQCQVETKKTKELLEKRKRDLKENLKQWHIELAMLQIIEKKELLFSKEMLDQDSENLPLVWAAG